MSHFAVLVVGNDVGAQLQPYHDFRCTGVNDEFVVTIDRLAEERRNYETRTTERLRSSDGPLFDPSEPQFFRDMTPDEIRQFGRTRRGRIRTTMWDSRDWGDGRGFRAKIQFMPEGYEKVDIPYRDIMSFAEYISYRNSRVDGDAVPDLDGVHKYGWYRINSSGEVVECIVRTNPNARWDWWIEGGRWSEFLQAKNGGYIISGLKSQIDFDQMRAKRAVAAAQEYEAFVLATRDCEIALSWDEVVSKHGDDIEAARSEYSAQPAVKAIRSSRILKWDSIEDYYCTLENYVERAHRRAIITFAVIIGGEWRCALPMDVPSQKLDLNAWAEEFNILIDDLPDDTRLTIVDCHS